MKKAAEGQGRSGWRRRWDRRRGTEGGGEGAKGNEKRHSAGDYDKPEAHYFAVVPLWALPESCQFAAASATVPKAPTRLRQVNERCRMRAAERGFVLLGGDVENRDHQKPWSLRWASSQLQRVRVRGYLRKSRKCLGAGKSVSNLVCRCYHDFICG